ncbi:hypothetical protein CEXT_628171 [Caerostris extrusa]|uniref:Secreted protein n=1 Tax=Caerostris extrusa TaxID=172846 RepID=A0AAV4YGA7_CAEEX|nr:hypothetical protein CEXT_628171 [Caerostris extrusa]
MLMCNISCCICLFASRKKEREFRKSSARWGSFYFNCCVVRGGISNLFPPAVGEGFVQLNNPIRFHWVFPVLIMPKYPQTSETTGIGSFGGEQL